MKCPFCANEIKDWVFVCPFCEESLIESNEKKSTRKVISSWNSQNSFIFKRWIVIFFSVVVCFALIWFLVKILSNWFSSSSSVIFEKKKLCTEMLDSYENYLKKTWTVVKAGWYYQSVNDIDLFYNSSYDSCIWTFYLSSNMYYSSINDITMNYMIYDYTNWNEELFSCFTKNDSWCFSKRKTSISELKDK